MQHLGSKATDSIRILVCVLLATLPGHAAAQLLFSGQSAAFIIDTDGDGPDADDCQATVVFSDPGITITLSETSASLAQCDGVLNGNVLFGTDSSSDFAEMMITNSTIPESAIAIPFPNLSSNLSLPFELEFVAESFPPPPPDGPPLEVNFIRYEDDIDEVTALAELCTAAGSTGVRFDLLGTGLGILFDLPAFPDTQNPTHRVLEGLPLERAAPNLGSIGSFDLYFPVDSSGAYTVAQQSSPSNLIFNIDPMDFPTCSGATIPSTIPALQRSAVALLVALMMLAGAVGWGVHRRGSRA